MKPTKTLSEQQYSFVLNYIRNGFNGYRAAVDAGYSESGAKMRASSLLVQPQIREHINKAKQIIDHQRLKELCVAFEDKAEVLTRIINDIIPKDKKIEPKRALYKDAIKAISELNKMCGDYAPEKRLALTVDATKERIQDAQKQYEEF